MKKSQQNDDDDRYARRKNKTQIVHTGNYIIWHRKQNKNKIFIASPKLQSSKNMEWK